MLLLKHAVYASCCLLWQLFFTFTTRAENIITYEETPRISFDMLATHPGNPSTYIPKSDMEAAVRLDTLY